MAIHVKCLHEKKIFVVKSHSCSNCLQNFNIPEVDRLSKLESQASLTPSNCPWPHHAVAADQPQWIFLKANNGRWAAMGALTSMLD